MTAAVPMREQIMRGQEGQGREDGHAERRAAARRSRSLAAVADAIEISSELEIPAPVAEVKTRTGVHPKLSAEALELARQVYYLHHGSLRDAARAVIAEGLSETDDLEKVAGRIRTWWDRNRWPKRAKSATFAIRDANNDGGLYRSSRMCRGLATGSGPATAGEPCGLSALKDSDYCFGHDPRPHYVAAREAAARRLQAGRQVDFVPIQPFADWCDATRRQMLLDAKRSGQRVHPNATGWGMLAGALQVDQSQLTRLVKKGITSRGKPTTAVSASTIVRYLAPLDVLFEDVYGFPAPLKSITPERLICPQCGGPKLSASAVCSGCFDEVGTQCNYFNRRGEQCGVSTEHESGFCFRCREIVFREHRPRVAKPSFVSNAMLTLATGAYAETPRLVVVGRRMWEANAGGVCDVFSSAKTLTGGLTREFRSRGWTTSEAIAEAHRDLVDDHGVVPWVAGAVQPLVSAGLLPPEPYVAWLRARYAELGSYVKLANRLRVNPDHLSSRLRGNDNSAIRRATIDQALSHWGDGTRFEDIYEGIIQ